MEKSDGKHSLTIKKCRPEDSGQITLTVTNKAGTTSTKTTLTVKGNLFHYIELLFIVISMLVKLAITVVLTKTDL